MGPSRNSQSPAVVKWHKWIGGVAGRRGVSDERTLEARVASRVCFARVSRGEDVKLVRHPPVRGARRPSPWPHRRGPVPLPSAPPRCCRVHRALHILDFPPTSGCHAIVRHLSRSLSELRRQRGIGIGSARRRRTHHPILIVLPRHGIVVVLHRCRSVGLKRPLPNLTPQLGEGVLSPRGAPRRGPLRSHARASSRCCSLFAVE